jgi:hypothetical protein
MGSLFEGQKIDFGTKDRIRPIFESLISEFDGAEDFPAFRVLK